MKYMYFFKCIFVFFFIVHERTTVEQFEMYINFKKKSFHEGDFSNLCSELNQEKCGPKRTVLQWKQVNLILFYF